MRKVMSQTYNQAHLGRLRRLVTARLDHTFRFRFISDTALREAYSALRQEVRAGADFWERVPVALALVEEACWRRTGKIPYEEQLICAVALADGFVVEMKTGEGKSLAAMLAACLLALRGHVHIATVNDYLARRDHENAVPVYDLLGLTSAVNYRDHPDKPALYRADVLHTSSSEAIFDYLRNEMYPRSQRHPFPKDAAVLDEIDFILMDNANTQFSITAGAGVRPPRSLFEQAAKVADLLRGQLWDRADDISEEEEPQGVHYLFSPHARRVVITEEGWRFLQDFLKTDDVIRDHFTLYRLLLRTLEARHFFFNGRDYIVDGGRIVLIHQENGRALPNSQLDPDLHTAIEVKEGVEITEKTVLSNTLDYRVFFSKYAHLVGMSGTVYDASEEFETIFGLPTLVLPTHRPTRRVELPDVFFATREQKYRYLIQLVSERPQVPVLVIAGSEAEANTVHAKLAEAGVDAQLLTTQTEAEEAAIVRAAGQGGRVTVSTNMAGRGTDIVLDKQAVEAGGLMVIILNRAASKRVDNQARGRAARQGEPGTCVFLLSLEDDLFRYLSPDQKRRLASLPAPDPETGRYPDQAASLLSAILDEVQAEIQSSLTLHRLMTYQFAVVVERQRVYLDHLIGDWCEDPEPEQRLLQFARRDDLDFHALWDGQLPDLAADPERRAFAVQEKCRRLGLDTSRRLLRYLFEAVARKEWMVYKDGAQEIAFGMYLHRLAPQALVDEYVRIMDNEFTTFLNQVQAGVLGYFLTAMPRQQIDVAVMMGENRLMTTN